MGVEQGCEALHGRWPEEGADFTKALRHIAQLRRKGEYGNTGVLINILSAGYWTEERRRDCNLEPDGICKRCKSAVESPYHRFWQCPENYNIPKADEKMHGSGITDKEFDNGIKDKEFDNGIKDKEFDNGIKDKEFDNGIKDKEFDNTMDDPDGRGPLDDHELDKDCREDAWTEPPQEDMFEDHVNNENQSDKDADAKSKTTCDPVKASEWLRKATENDIRNGENLGLWLRGITPAVRTRVSMPRAARSMMVGEHCCAKERLSTRRAYLDGSGTSSDPRSRRCGGGWRGYPTKMKTTPSSKGGSLGTLEMNAIRFQKQN
jgi:hypothetical protein